MTSPAAVIVLAAGEGTRMKSTTPKVLHEICGRALLGHVITVAATCGAARTVVVLGHQRERVATYLGDQYPEVVTTEQAEQNGTGHAVRVTLEQLAQQGMPVTGGAVVVVSGDSPLLSASTLQLLLG